MSSEQLIALVNEDFGLRTKGKDKVQMLKELNDFLIRHYAKGYHSVLIIDEAQNLGPELLEEVRMLSNLETDSAKLLHIILVGQPELRKTISLPELEQLRQRININCHISPLTRGEAEEYILHRLEVAGNRDAVHFSGETLDIIYHYSRGIPRLLNVICDFILLSAFVEETKDLSADMVRDIIGDLELENRYWEFRTALKGVQGRRRSGHSGRRRRGTTRR
ncbi:MAG: AAA family ATPase [Thermodesulfovibrionales bacterium]